MSTYPDTVVKPRFTTVYGIRSLLEATSIRKVKKIVCSTTLPTILEHDASDWWSPMETLYGTLTEVKFTLPAATELLSFTTEQGDQQPPSLTR